MGKPSNSYTSKTKFTMPRMKCDLTSRLPLATFLYCFATLSSRQRLSVAVHHPFVYVHPYVSFDSRNLNHMSDFGSREEVNYGGVGLGDGASDLGPPNAAFAQSPDGATRAAGAQSAGKGGHFPPGALAFYGASLWASLRRKLDTEV